MKRYHSVVILLHWFMALAFILMLASGLVMTETVSWVWPLDPRQKFDLYQWHKSLGVMLLGLIFVRLAVRLCTGGPPMPVQFSSGVRLAARLGHIMLYLLMLVVPFSGWLMVSASILGLPTMVFSWFIFPHIPGVAANSLIEQGARMAHKVLAYSFGAMILLHLAAVIKHAWGDRINLLSRMFWWRGVGVICLGLWAMPVMAETQSSLPQGSSWQIDYSKSHIGFSGNHAGTVFSGSFSEWRADIQVDPARPALGRVVADFFPASARTGNPMYDGTLPQADWFDVQNYPVAHFVSRQIVLKSDGVYGVVGDLTVRGVTRPIEFDVILSDPARPPVRIQAVIPIDRLAFGIGRQSDPSAAWVRAEISVKIDLVATP